MHRDIGRDPELSVQATAGTGAGEGEAVTEMRLKHSLISQIPHTV